MCVCVCVCVCVLAVKAVCRRCQNEGKQTIGTFPRASVLSYIYGAIHTQMCRVVVCKQVMKGRERKPKQIVNSVLLSA